MSFRRSITGPERHAEVAGAGFAGLTVAALLAERGWSVRVHERSDEVREIGAGIFIHNNGLLVLEEMGLMETLRPMGVRLLRDRMVDGRGRVLQDRVLENASRTWAFPRQSLVNVLHQAAVDRGVEIVPNSLVESALADGTLVLANGARARAALAVAADGHRSAIRASLGLTAETRQLATVSIRYLLPSRDLAPDPVTTEHWSGRRRVAFAACSESQTYVYMACPQGDERAGEVPLDVDAWAESFPNLVTHLRALSGAEPFRSHYSYVRCTSWSRGRVSLLGDAAHALPPTLGQGTNLALTNARSLVSFLERHDDVEPALAEWERSVRRVTDATQRWAARYDLLTRYWPPALGLARASVIWAFGAWPFLNDRMRIADRTPPVGS